MAYATYAEVQGLLPGRISVTSESTPSITDVTQWLDDYSAEVDVLLALAGVVSIPLTAGTSQYKYVSICVRKRVAYQIMSTKSTNRDPDRKPYWEDYLKDWESLIEYIKSGDWPVDDTSDQLPASRTMEAETNDDASMQPKFKSEDEP